MKKNLVWVIISLLVIMMFAWSPWITKEFSEKRVVDNFSVKWTGMTDGCGSFNEKTKRIEPNLFDSNKALFGYEVIISYECTWTGSFEDTVFVSPFGTVHTIVHQTGFHLNQG